MSESGRTVQTTVTSLKIIETIHDLGGATISELANELKLGDSTVLNHVNTLEEEGYLRKTNNHYQIGLRFLFHSEHAKSQRPGYKKARELTRRLAKESREEADFSVEERGRIIILCHEIGHQYEPGQQIGEYFFMHNTAAGKAILAEWSDKEIAAVLNKWGLPKATDHTLVDEDTLRTDIEIGREQGYMTNEQEYVDGYRSISVAATLPEEGPIGAFSIGAPTYRISRDELVENNLGHLKSATRKLRQHLMNERPPL